jgi:hypothetical protein
MDLVSGLQEAQDTGDLAGVPRDVSTPMDRVNRLLQSYETEKQQKFVSDPKAMGYAKGMIGPEGLRDLLGTTPTKTTMTDFDKKLNLFRTDPTTYEKMFPATKDRPSALEEKINLYKNDPQTYAKIFPNDPSAFAEKLAFFRESPGEYQQMFPNSGIQIETGPDGTTVSIGGVTKKVQGEIEGGILESSVRLDDLTHLEELWDPEFLMYSGKMKAWMAAGFNKLTDKQLFDDFGMRQASFAKKLMQFTLRWRKWVTGVAGNEKEFKAIEKSTINMYDSPDQFRAGMAMLRDDMQRRRVRMQMFKEQGLDIWKDRDAWQRYIEENPLFEIQSADDFVAEQQQKGLSDGQIIEMLKIRGYD